MSILAPQYRRDFAGGCPCVPSAPIPVPHAVSIQDFSTQYLTEISVIAAVAPLLGNYRVLPRASDA